MTPCCSFQNLNLICDFKVSLRPLIHSSFQQLKVEGGSLSLAPAALMVEQRGGITKVETLFLLPVKRWSVSVFGSLSMGTVWTRWQSQGDNFTDSDLLSSSPLGYLPTGLMSHSFSVCASLLHCGFSSKTAAPNLTHPLQLTLGPTSIWRIHMSFLLGTGILVREQSWLPLLHASPHCALSPPFFPPDLRAQGRSLVGPLVMKIFTWSTNCQPPLQDVVRYPQENPCVRNYYIKTDLSLIRRQSPNLIEPCKSQFIRKTMQFLFQNKAKSGIRQVSPCSLVSLRQDLLAPVSCRPAQGCCALTLLLSLSKFNFQKHGQYDILNCTPQGNRPNSRKQSRTAFQHLALFYAKDVLCWGKNDLIQPNALFCLNQHLTGDRRP